ncbi:Mitochondrial tRNAs modification protein [Dimargaris verticillata]|uniref:N(6)-L-threonylcarbamoyladenine synthase n=1 Tax=Dimargaris verticillata TaxID=2761393 RepID=A0A9W8B258_9FUNG|nr:Mitochondrial tRNAs modification protein [Dimargaris verticillata]
MGCHWSPLPGLSRRTLSVSQRPVRVLGLETSCDDTAAAVVDGNGQVLGEALAGQQDAHEPNGGIVPTLALQKHTQNTPFVVKEALERSGLSIHDIDAIAVTRGPGIGSSLSVGLNAAKTLAAVCGLLISGGHTLLVIVHDVNEYTQLGTTTDDSVGDAFDKVARGLRLPWKPGRGGGAGAALEAVAVHGDPQQLPFQLTVPLSTNQQASSLNFSFSGLKTDVFRRINDEATRAASISDTVDPAKPPRSTTATTKVDPYTQRFSTTHPPLGAQFTANLAAAFQEAVLKHILRRLKLTMAHCNDQRVQPTALVVSGGVASNQYLRSNLTQWMADHHQLQVLCPPPRLCTDNGVMVAWAGIERMAKGYLDDYGIGIVPRWPLEALRHWPKVPGHD